MLIGVVSCGARTGLFLDESAPASSAVAGAAALPPASCGTAPQCVTRDASDPCGPARLVDPECDAATLQWHCPAGAWAYARAPESSSCLPLQSSAPAVAGLAASLSRFPTADGRCLWVAEELDLASGEVVHNIAFEPDLRAPFGTCPSEAQFVTSQRGLSTSAFFADGSSIDPSRQYVQITGGFLSGGQTLITYRLFSVDPNAVFGVTELGTGLGRWDVASERILLSPQPRFATDLDYGNASFTDGDYAYLWGCNAPGPFFLEGCLLARRDHSDRIELFTSAQTWSATARPSQGAIVFDDGPWLSSVQRSAASSNLVHVFANDFADHLQIQSAAHPEGPWSDARTLAPCVRPSADPQAYCAGPVVHAELADPTRPNELVVSYGVATTGPGTGALGDYWSRLTWLSQ